jgi:hypothetical protein
MGTVDGEILLFEVSGSWANMLCSATSLRLTGMAAPSLFLQQCLTVRSLQKGRAAAVAAGPKHPPTVCMYEFIAEQLGLLQGTEPRATFSVDEGHSVESLAAYSKGFVAGLDGGLVALFDKDEREYYRRTRTFTVMEHLLPVRCEGPDQPAAVTVVHSAKARVCHRTSSGARREACCTCRWQCQQQQLLR